MGKSRPRYNEKARASSAKPNQRSHPKARGGGLQNQDGLVLVQQSAKAPADTNAAIIDPLTLTDNAVELPKFKMPTKYMSKKKRKRLEKYIDQKLKKDARADLMEDLSTSSWSSDLLKSSKMIGRPAQTLREQLKQAMLEQKAGIHTNDNPDLPLMVETEVDEDQLDLTMFQPATPADPAPATAPALAVGSALKDGAMPLIKKKRKKKKSTIPKSSRKRFKQRQGEEVDSDDSFDSSDSANDTGSDEDQDDTPKARPLVQEITDLGPSAMEQVQEAIKHVTGPIPKHVVEEDDQIKIQLLKANTEGDLSNDVSKHFSVIVDRDPAVQEARLKLPVCGEEQVIMEAIRNNTVVIICGETGSGKTTQVPQFLYEAGWSHPDSDNPGLIGVTQPRRVATVSMAKRVGHELNLSEDEVSYQIRYDATVSDKTRIKFMTDGVLLRELSQDLLLTKYSVLIIDEAHERNLNTDILIGVVSRVLKLRAQLSREDREKIQPLRVVIMSATLRVTDFTENKTLFATPPPVINVNARQFPVNTHFNRRTPEDHLSEAFKKVCKIHQKLPHGGILVFLTGQNEITQLCRQLRKKYPSLPANASKKAVADEKDGEALESQTEKIQPGKEDLENEDIDLGENQVQEDFDLETDSEDDDDLGFEEDEMEQVDDAPLHVLPLYSMLPTEAQLRVFEPPPEGSRLCVIATNVAETSVTIPGVRYVVDSGKAKERQFDMNTGVQSFQIGWTSKAAADQRAGRAGRTGPGHCYRLYSSAVFDNEFERFTKPEIQRMPIEGVVLNMKSMHIDNVINFPFPTPPPRDSLSKAEKMLGYLGAVNTTTKQITAFGETMSLFPITPRFAKMLTVGQQHECLAYVIAIVSALSVGDPFIQDYHLDENRPGDEEDSEDDLDQQELSNFHNESAIDKQKRKLVRKKYYQTQVKHSSLDPKSDIIKLLNVVGAYEYAGGSSEFCNDSFLRPRAMEDIRKLRRQLTNMVAANFPGVNVCVDPKMAPPSALQLKVLRQVMMTGLIDCVAMRQDVVDTEGGKGQRFKNASNVPYKLMWSDDVAYIHPSSILYGQEPPPILVYTELFKSTRTWLKGCTTVESKWLAKIGKSLCTFGRPLEYPKPTPIAGKPNERLCHVVPNFGPKGWPLPPLQVTQRRDGTRWTTML
ncbi:P-loop containing nucleoside triphosphate hydrolase protein [Hesseltinella vesiculosa]|uniref:RNA helicase n=1 Tax=Hesseltinella vesiculosa TaxID=101127 RepID=A0A1X2GN26_9FUNG|nr:P-loop containing nucleoside triphosphate hydrolase protein [Hesseltinella vesiculosa]